MRIVEFAVEGPRFGVSGDPPPVFAADLTNAGSTSFDIMVALSRRQEPRTSTKVLQYAPQDIVVDLERLDFVARFMEPLIVPETCAAGTSSIGNLDLVLAASEGKEAEMETSTRIAKARVSMPRLALLAVVPALISTGCDRATEPTPAVEDAPQSSQVQAESAPAMPAHATGSTAPAQVYRIYCASCHGAEGKGDGPAAPHNPEPRDFSAGEFKFDADGDGRTGEREDLRAVVRDGAGAYGGSSLMAPWGSVLSDAQLEAVVDHVLELAGRDGTS